jgi:hypothetical protein
MRLYDYYSRRDPDYVTSSYNHYCLYFNSGSSNIVTVFDRYSSNPERFRALPTGSFTMEAWFKPFTTGTSGVELTIFGRARSYRMYLDGSTGKLNFDIHSGTNAVHTTVTSSIAVTPLQWHHAAISFDHTTLTGAMYLDLQQVASFTYPSPIPNPNNYTGSLHIGAAYGGAVSQQFSHYYENVALHAAGQAGSVFHGFIGNVRIWGANRSWAQISASHNVRLTGSGLAAPLLCDIQLSEGPLVYASPSGDVSGFIVSYASGGLVGSGVLDHAAAYQAKSPDYGVLYKFSDRIGPVWHPNDNARFYVPKEFIPTKISGTNWSSSGSLPVERLRILSIPAGFTGRQITKGSVRVTDNTYSASTHGLRRTLIDDGRGGLYLSGSAALGSTDSHGSVGWNKVGNVFYNEGLIVIKDPALLDFAHPTEHASDDENNLLQLEFRGNNRIYVKTLMCRIDRGDYNASLNPTFYRTEEDGNRVRRYQTGSLYITTVGIYNSSRELVGVARLAEPLRGRPRDRMNIKLRLDF